MLEIGSRRLGRRARRGLRGQRRALAAAVVCGCGGCTPVTPGAGAWGFVALALLLVALACFVVGWMRGARQHLAALRQARAELRLWSDLGSACAWRTDRHGRLLHWRAPDGAAASAAWPLPGELLADCFVPAADSDRPPLASLLQAERPFGSLRVRRSESVSGDRAAGGAAAGGDAAGGGRADAGGAGGSAPRGGQRWELAGSPCFDDQGRFDGFAGSAHATDAQAEADDQRRASAAALDPALAASAGPAAVAFDDGQGWVLRHVNPSALALWPHALPGRPLADWAAALPATVAAALALLEPGRSVDAGGWRLVRFDAAPGVQGLLMTQLRGTADAPADGAPTGEADTFSFTVSHDLRAPIRVVEGFTRIVKEDYGRLLDRVGNDHLDRVLSAAARMNLMIDALLTLARLSSQPLARQPVNLTQLAAWVVEDLRRGAPERVADIEIESGLTAHGDPTLLRLVLENLLGNAWKYTGRCERAHIVLRTAQHGDKRVFEVGDNGAGFDMRSAERLFGLFQRLHSANDFPGHGVGLASVRRIVQRHGGQIWAEAEPGKGATFRFTLAG